MIKMFPPESPCEDACASSRESSPQAAGNSACEHSAAGREPPGPADPTCADSLCAGAKRETELSVIAKAKELSSYILTVTDKSPKRFRFTLTTRLQNYSLDVIEDLYLANESFASAGGRERERRLALQHRALTRLKMLLYTAQLAMEQGAILNRQYQQLSRLAFDCRNLLGAWISSDRRRFGGK